MVEFNCSTVRVMFDSLSKASVAEKNTVSVDRAAVGMTK